MNVYFIIAIKKHHARPIIERKITSNHCFCKCFPAIFAHVVVLFHMANAEMKSQWLHLGVLFVRRTSPSSNISIACAINHHFGMKSNQAILVCNMNCLDPSAQRVYTTDKRIKKNRERTLLFPKKIIKKKFKLEGVGNSGVVFGNCFSIGGAHA